MNHVILNFICDGDECHTLPRICCGFSLNMQVLVWKKKPVLKQLLSFFQVRNLPCGVAGESRSEVKWSVFVWRQSRPRFSAAAARNRDLLGAASFFGFGPLVSKRPVLCKSSPDSIFFSVIFCVLPQLGAIGFKINLQESASHIKNHIIKEAIAELA